MHAKIHSDQQNTHVYLFLLCCSTENLSCTMQRVQHYATSSSYVILWKKRHIWHTKLPFSVQWRKWKRKRKEVISKCTCSSQRMPIFNKAMERDRQTNRQTDRERETLRELLYMKFCGTSTKEANLTQQLSRKVYLNPFFIWCFSTSSMGVLWAVRST